MSGNEFSVFLPPATSARKSTRVFFSATSVRAAISLLFKLRKLLVIERDGRATAYKPVLVTKLCYSFFRVAKLLAQFDQAIAQPTGGLFGRLKSGVELVNNIGVCHRVGELRGFGRIGRGDGNTEHLGPAAPRHR